MPYFLLCASIVLCVLKSATYNYYAKEEQPNLHQVFRFNFISYAISAIIPSILALSSGITVTLPTILCAIGYAVIVLTLQSIMIFAMQKGSMATTSLLNMYGMVIPALAGPFFWGEQFGIVQAIGLVAMLVSVFFLSDTKNSDKTPGEDEDKTANKKATITSIVLGASCFLFSGLAGLMEKIHQSTPAHEERMPFLAIAYLTMVLFSFIVCFISRKSYYKPLHQKRFYGVSVAVGVIASIYGAVNLFLAGAMDSLTYYPIANGGALLFTVLLSIAIFKEKPTAKKIIGFILGLIAVILLCIQTV